MNTNSLLKRITNYFFGIKFKKYDEDYFLVRKKLLPCLHTQSDIDGNLYICTLILYFICQESKLQGMDHP